MEAKRSLYLVALLIVCLLSPSIVNAGACDDCIFSLPFQATPGCKDFNYSKELKPFNPSDLFKKCTCQLADAPNNFDLCNQTCSSYQVESLKSQITTAAAFFNCNKVLGKSSAASSALNTELITGVVITATLSHFLFL
ncbi:hypothetical protein K7432_014949 [Basidiobolus ranarum]|uniref:Uncharacterized protein n=1 Tax=Basidiobolus ranarum TaxID=34480 RepID=A0ABR2WGU4_9FUNG